MIHTTIGIYPNGTFKVNGVQSEDLQNHIAYNKTYRFGRALMVDGILVYDGMINADHLKEIISSHKLDQVKQTAPTIPYR